MKTNRNRAPRGVIAPLILSVAAALFLTGCPPTCPTTSMSRDELVSRYNHNAAKVPRLWARARMSASFLANGRRINWGWAALSPNALLIMHKNQPSDPHDFVLIGQEAGSEIFRLGSSTSDDVYYFWYNAAGNSGGWFGLNRFAGAPGVGPLPFDPHQLAEVLAITLLPEDYTNLPTVLLTLNDRSVGDECSYVLTFVNRQNVSQRLYARREVLLNWQDNVPPRPYMMRFLDDAGRRIVVAHLDNWRPIAVEDVDNPPDQPPTMPTDIRVEWPLQDSSIRLRLSEMTTADRALPELFLFWERMPAAVMGQMQQVDEQLVSIEEIQ